MYTVLLLDETKRDVRDARLYFKSLVSGLEKRFDLDLIKIIELLKEKPYNFGFRYEEFRTANLQISLTRYITKLTKKIKQ